MIYESSARAVARAKQLDQEHRKFKFHQTNCGEDKRRLSGRFIKFIVVIVISRIHSSLQSAQFQNGLKDDRVFAELISSIILKMSLALFRVCGVQVLPYFVTKISLTVNYRVLLYLGRSRHRQTSAFQVQWRCRQRRKRHLRVGNFSNHNNVQKWRRVLINQNALFSESN